MAILKLQRYFQDPGCCAVAASASVANFYYPKMNYALVSKIAKNDGSGMHTPAIAILLNQLGFTKVTIISADVNQLDFSWKNFTRRKMVGALRKSVKDAPNKDYKAINEQYVEFLANKDCDNNLIIDHRFGDYIRSAIDAGKPVLASFNWNMFFEWTKWNDDGMDDAIKGEAQEHEVAICGYDDHTVSIVDSHHEMYKGKLKRYKNGRYKMPWETLMTVMGYGDLIIPENYDPARLEINELV
jgi:hypothetical protein